MATIAHAVKKLSKYGEVKKSTYGNNTYTVTKDGYEVKVMANGGDYSGEVAVIRVRGINDIDDFQTDYHAGVFADNISQAIRIAHWE